MNNKDQAGITERTAGIPAELPSATRQAEEFSASRRGRVRTYFYNHPRLMDLVVVLCYFLAASGSALAPVAGNGMALHLLIVVVGGVVLFFRRRSPLMVLAIMSVLEILNISVMPTSSNVGAGLWFALYAVAVRYSGRVSFSLAAAASIPLILYTLFFYQYPSEYLRSGGPDAVASNIIVCVVVALSNTIATGIGSSVRRTREHEEELRRWAIRNAQLASVAERNRIAREMHDVVAHSLTVMVALSDGAAVVVKRDPAKAGEVLGQLSQTGRNALKDMRRVLGVLREDGDDGARAPQPDDSDLVALFEGFRQAGMPLSVTQSGPALPKDPAFELTVYRIVQESLTNVLRYGTSISRVRVLIENDVELGRVRVLVTDDGKGSIVASKGTGRGISGMADRARIYGGTVVAGVSPRGGWSVEALLFPSWAKSAESN